MSIKNNTTSLQNLLEVVNALPDANTAPVENLDAEISTQTTLISEQDAKIAELAEVLAGKADGGGNVKFLYNVEVVSNQEVEWWYIWDNEHKSIAIFISEYNSYSPGITSFKINGAELSASEYSHMTLGTITIIVKDRIDGNVILNINYDTSTPSPY